MGKAWVGWGGEGGEGRVADEGGLDGGEVRRLLRLLLRLLRRLGAGLLPHLLHLPPTRPSDYVSLSLCLSFIAHCPAQCHADSHPGRVGRAGWARISSRTCRGCARARPQGEKRASMERTSPLSGRRRPMHRRSMRPPPMRAKARVPPSGCGTARAAWAAPAGRVHHPRLPHSQPPTTRATLSARAKRAVQVRAHRPAPRALPGPRPGSHAVLNPALWAAHRAVGLDAGGVQLPPHPHSLPTQPRHLPRQLLLHTRRRRAAKKGWI
jgi:hypothetical protein